MKFESYKSMIMLILLFLTILVICPAQESRAENQPPVASFAYTPLDPRVGEEVILNAATSTDPDGSIFHYEWDIDSDGVIDASGIQTSWRFGKPGQYEVQLIVIDDQGLSSSATQVVTVTGKGRPTGFMPFVSGGIAPLDPLTIVRVAAGIPFGGNLLGQISLGYGSGETMKGGYPVTINATAVDFDVLYGVARGLYVGGGAGLLMLRGRYHIQWPVVGSKYFNQTVFTLNIMFGVKLGPVMLEGGFYAP